MDVPLGWVQDQDGKPTTNAHGVKDGGALLPLGGDPDHASHKGYILGSIVDIFSFDLGSIRWVTFEDAHVAGFADPPNAVRARPGQDLTSMLLAGEIDAAVMTGPIADPRIKTLIPDPAAAAQTWQDKHGAIQLNHLVAVRNALCEEHPDAVREVYRLLGESKRAAGLPRPAAADLNPFGIAQNRRNLEVAIDITFQQGLIPRRFEVDELFHSVARKFA
jgi:4,5-dihydroxyphthalate decarboxylase